MWHRPLRIVVPALAALAASALGGCAATTGSAPRTGSTPHARAGATGTESGSSTTTPASAMRKGAPSPSSKVPTTSTTAVAAPSTSVTSTSAGATSTSRAGARSTGSPAPGLVAGQVTALGDSVMLDYETDLKADLAGLRVDFHAAVSEQFSTGAALAAALRAEGRLGAVVVVALGTNGPISAADLSTMERAVSGATLVVFVTVHVDQPWEAAVNASLRAAASAVPNGVVADWAALAAGHASWFYSDGTHLPEQGAGARALAQLIARAITTRASD